MVLGRQCGEGGVKEDSADCSLCCKEALEASWPQSPYPPVSPGRRGRGRLQTRAEPAAKGGSALGGIGPGS